MKHAEVAMKVAKKDLLEKGKVLPTLVMVPGHDRPQVMTAAGDRNLIPAILKKENPEAFTWATELWVRKPDTEERREAIEVLGGSGILRVLMRQGFHRQDGKILFDDTWGPSDVELTGFAVNLGMSDGVLGEIMGVWDVAPAEGRVFYVPTRGFRIWIPQGWRMAREIAADDGKPRPTFYRNTSPHGAVRVTTFWQTTAEKQKLAETRDLRAEAQAEAERRRRVPGVENVTVEEKRNSAIVSFSQIVHERDHRTRMHAWLIHDPQGHILVSFASNVNDQQSELIEELTSIREIVDRIDRL